MPSNVKPKKSMRKAFTLIELILGAVIFGIVTTAGLLLTINDSRKTRVEKTFRELTTMLHFITTTDSTNIMTGFLRSGENCLDNSFKDATGDKAVFEKMVLCLGSDHMGSFASRVTGTGASSIYNFLEVSCSLKMAGSATRDDTFVFTLDCSSFPVPSPNQSQKKERAYLLKTIADYASTKEEWGIITQSTTLDADNKILTIEMRY